MTPFLDGLLHPLIVPAHFLAVVALALLIGQQGWGRSVPMVYAAAVVGALGGIALAYVPTRAGEGVMVSAAAAGVLVALATPLPRFVGWLLGAATGAALGLDSPPEAISLREANLTLAGTALGSTVALLILAMATSRLRHGWQRVAVRIFGSWIAASAILVLALRMVR